MSDLQQARDCIAALRRGNWNLDSNDALALAVAETADSLADAVERLEERVRDLERRFE